MELKDDNLLPLMHHWPRAIFLGKTFGNVATMELISNQI
jgi:hypothetical protein